MAEAGVCGSERCAGGCIHPTACPGIGAKIMDDLYAFALPHLSQIQLPKNVHFTMGGSEVLAGQVTDSIRQALKETKP